MTGFTLGSPLRQHIPHSLGAASAAPIHSRCVDTPSLRLSQHLHIPSVAAPLHSIVALPPPPWSLLLTVRLRALSRPEEHLSHGPVRGAPCRRRGRRHGGEQVGCAGENRHVVTERRGWGGTRWRGGGAGWCRAVLVPTVHCSAATDGLGGATPAVLCLFASAFCCTMSLSGKGLGAARHGWTRGSGREGSQPQP